MTSRVRTLGWDDGWFVVGGDGLVGPATDDAWHAVERGRRVAEQLGVPHVVELPGERVVEDPGQVAAADREPPWTAALLDQHAAERARAAGARARRAAERLAQLRGTDAAVTAAHADVAQESAREAVRHASAARARAADVLERSAEAHESAAAMHEGLAERGVDPARHRARAAFHRQAAHVNWGESRSRRAGGRPDVTVHRDLVVIGASAGGVEALRTVVAGLPRDFGAAVVVVLHIPAASRSALAAILDRAGPLPAAQVREGDRIEPGRVLVAPPDRHVIVAGDTLTLSRGPRENGHRPAVDVLFRSAAHAAGPRVVGVVLSGTLDDGAAGLAAVHERGGLGVVQDPADAPYAGMPQAAIEGDAPDAVLPVHAIARYLREVVGTVAQADVGPAPTLLADEVAMAVPEPGTLSRAERPGRPSGFACPDCHGVLFEIDDGALRRYRCRVGHAWSEASLAAQQTTAVEGALWAAMRALEEKAALSDRLADGARARGHQLTATAFDAQAGDSREAALVLRDLVERTTTVDAAALDAAEAAVAPLEGSPDALS